MEEVADLDVGGGVATEKVWNRNYEVGEIDATKNNPDGRHDDIGDEGTDDFRKGGADDHTDGEIHHATLVNKFFEFFDEFAISNAHNLIIPYLALSVTVLTVRLCQLGGSVGVFGEFRMEVVKIRVGAIDEFFKIVFFSFS